MKRQHTHIFDGMGTVSLAPKQYEFGMLEWTSKSMSFINHSTGASVDAKLVPKDEPVRVYIDWIAALSKQGWVVVHANSVAISGGEVWVQREII